MAKLHQERESAQKEILSKNTEKPVKKPWKPYHEMTDSEDDGIETPKPEVNVKKSKKSADKTNGKSLDESKEKTLKSLKNPNCEQKT